MFHIDRAGRSDSAGFFMGATDMAVGAGIASIDNPQEKASLSSR